MTKSNLKISTKLKNKLKIIATKKNMTMFELTNLYLEEAIKDDKSK